MNRFEDRLRLLTPAPASEGLRSRIAHPARRRPAWSRIVPMASAAAALLAVVAWVVVSAPPRSIPSQDSAEAALRKIEETLAKAKTLHVKIRRDAVLAQTPQVPAEKVRTNLTILMKEGNRLLVDLKEIRQADKAGSPTAHFLIMSDGKRMKRMVLTEKQAKDIGGVSDTPATLNARFALALARASASTPVNLVMIELEDLRKSLAVSELQRGPDEEGFATLTYRVGPYGVKLLYDPKSFLPVQRTLTNEALGTFKENYAFWIDDPLDDQTFILRPEK